MSVFLSLLHLFCGFRVLLPLMLLIPISHIFAQTCLLQIEANEKINQLKSIKHKPINSVKDLPIHYLTLDTLITEHKYEDKEWINKVINKAMVENDSLVNYSFTWSYFVMLYGEERFKEALELATQLIEYAESSNFNISGDFYIEAGWIHGHYGDHTKELDNYLDAIKVYKKNESDNITYAYGCLGALFETIGELDKALEYQFEGLTYAKKMKTENEKYYNTTYKYVSIANILALQNKNDEAEKYFENAIVDSYKQKTENIVIASFANFIKFSTEQKDYKKVDSLIRTADSILLDTKKTAKKLYVNYYLMVKSIYALDQNNFSLLSHPDTLLNANISDELKEEIYDYAILYFKKLGKPEKALQYGILQNEQLKDRINKQFELTINLLEAKKKSAIVLSENFELKEKTRKRKNTQTFLLGLLLISGIFFIFLFRSYKKTNQLSKDLADKNTEIVKQLNELERITYATTHDLKEPANTIHNFSTFISKNFKNDLPEEGKYLFGLLEQTSNGMIQSIELLHNYLVVGQTSQLSTNDLNKIVAKAQLRLSNNISTKEAKITVSNLPTTLCYAVEMELLFQNLLSNAIKYAKKNISPKINIRYTDFEDYFKFEVQDNGIGISEKNQNQIFELFQRLHIKSEIEGTGIGLASARKIVEMHKGNIWIQSIPDVGSTFYFTISKNL